MNQGERKLIEQLIKSVEHVGVTQSEYDANFKKTEITPFHEVHRLLGSEDYKLGWNNCKKTIVEQLQLLLDMSAKKAVKRGPYKR